MIFTSPHCWLQQSYMDWLLLLNMSIKWCFYIHCLSFKNNPLISFLFKKISYFDTWNYINSLRLKPELLKDGYKAMLSCQANTQIRYSSPSPSTTVCPQIHAPPFRESMGDPSIFCLENWPLEQVKYTNQLMDTDASNVLAFQNTYFLKSFNSKSVFSFSQNLHAKNSFICMS